MIVVLKKNRTGFGRFSSFDFISMSKNVILLGIYYVTSTNQNNAGKATMYLLTTNNV